ncbi:MAG: 2-phosphosulfolactate phosphatase [Chloroflexi bacterium]|nr:2-phosphosulfolactate phosphatase [Chloroflexota bacterium]
MIVSVAITPNTAPSVDGRVCIVLDVLRASSTMLAMFGAGAAELHLAETPEAAFAIASADRTAHWLCGERAGLRCEGFDFGNSPSEFLDANLSGRRVVYVTSNGTRALHTVATSPLVLVGSPRNEVAVVRQALREAAARQCDLLLVCAGDRDSSGVSLEDVFGAGLLVDRMLRLCSTHIVPEDAASSPAALALDDSAILAHRLYRSYLHGRDGTNEGALRSVFAEARSGRHLPKHGFGPDLEYCAEVDVTTVVPRLDVRCGRLVVVIGTS